MKFKKGQFVIYQEKQTNVLKVLGKSFYIIYNPYFDIDLEEECKVLRIDYGIPCFIRVKGSKLKQKQ
jgi:hypothetical protein